MAFFKVAIFACFVAVVYARPGYAPLAVAHAPVAVAHAAPVAVDYFAPAHYQFSYGVHDPHTGDVKEQSEQREGDSVVGHYSLLEPDGTTRTVHYTADPHTGFNAVVEKSGHAVHPTTPVVAHAAPIATVGHVAPALSYAPAVHAAGYGGYYGGYGGYYGGYGYHG